MTEPAPIRVVVMEDFPLVRDGFVCALDRDPAITVVADAGDGAEGMDKARALRPDVIVLDLHMPGHGGMWVLDQVREHLPETRVLVVTADEHGEALLDAVSAGAAGYLTKRTSAEDMCRAVVTVHEGGSVITPGLAAELLREFSGAQRGQPTRGRPALAEREQAILRLVAQGHTDEEIGRRLFISPRTVQNHLTRVREKTGLRRRAELTRWAVEHALA